MVMRAAAICVFTDDCQGGCRGDVELLETLARKVSAYCREDRNVRRFYIGIASGIDAEGAMRRRHDAYKKVEGVNEMIALYRSSCERSTKHVEAYLVKMYVERTDNINRTGGGGGRPSEGPKYFVYLAVRRWGRNDR